MSFTLERRNTRIVLALMIPAVPATGLGITVQSSEQHHVEKSEDDSPGWDRLDYNEWSVLDRQRLIQHTNQQSRRIPFDDLYFRVGTGTSELTDFVVSEAQSNRWRTFAPRTKLKAAATFDRESERARSSKQLHTTLVTDVAAAVDDIRSALSLSITELSAILDVKRPTIYSWLRGDSQPHSINLERIAILHQISKRWNELSGRQLRRHLRHAFDKNGTTLFGLLKKDDLNMDEIENHLIALASLPSAEKLPSVRELSAELGLVTVAHPDAEIVRDIESGRRFDND